MLIRTDGERTILITQPAHAALSAQLSRSWGNADFGDVEPYEDVCLAALMHDIGWLDWEQSPTLNPATGRPHSFLELPTRVHLNIWETASRRALTFGRYPALLTSMHFTGLYERFHDYSRDSDEDARDARALVARELAFQDKQIAALRADSRMAAMASDRLLERNRRLVALWDAMSLAICHGLTGPRTFTDVPAATGAIELVLTPDDPDATVDPWPFRTDHLVVTVEGKVVTERYDRQSSLESAMVDAPWATLRTRLVPAR